MSGLLYQTFSLAKTKTRTKLHIIKYANRSWCNHEVVGEVRRNVSFDEFEPLMRNDWELCPICYDGVTFADVRRMRKRGLLAHVARMERTP